MSLLASAPSEAVLAFELAHAMGHVAGRHGTRQATKAELMQISQVVAQNSTAVPVGGLAFARSAEREADYLAVQFVARAGYDPEAMAAWLAGQPAQGGSPVFAVRAPANERAAAIRKEIQAILAPAKYEAATGNFAEAKAVAATIH
jgi:beta-barrel assembly-enhancing protease